MTFDLPAAPLTTKDWTCGTLAQEEATPQESWVFWVSIYRLNKSINNSLSSLHGSPHKGTVNLRFE